MKDSVQRYDSAPGMVGANSRSPAESDAISRRQFVSRAAIAIAAAGWVARAHGADGVGSESAPTRLVPVGGHGRFDALGPLIEFFTPGGDDVDYAVSLGTLPPRYTVPMHSHPDDESFYLLSGRMQGLTDEGDGLEWFDVPPAGFVHVPRDSKHAWRNVGDVPVVQLIVTSARLGQFFRDACRPLAEGESPRPPTPKDIERFTQTAWKYGHWLASPEENAAVGIKL
jgi:quercetin dioxygenase-like cupin family protein